MLTFDDLPIFLLLRYAEELNVLQPTEIGRGCEENLRPRDALRGFEILFSRYGFRGERGPERPERTAIDDVALRAILVEHLAELVEHSSHVGSCISTLEWKTARICRTRWILSHSRL